MRRLVLVRPEPGASASAAAARALGLAVVTMPLFEVVAMPWAVPDPDEYDALLLTSANAVRHGGAGIKALQRLPVAAVGRATAAAAIKAGFAVATEGTAGIDELLATLPTELRLLHLAGHDRIAPSDRDRRIESITVYEARPTTPAILADLAGTVVALHSPRAAARLAELTDPSRRAATAIVALSPAVAAAAGSGWQRIDIADAPTDAALLALAARLCL